MDIKKSSISKQLRTLGETKIVDRYFITREEIKEALIGISELNH